jgi:large subunit ribosomal protein L30
MTAKKSAAKKGAAKKSDKKIRVQQVRSPIGFPRSQREVLRSLGLRRIRQVVEHSDNPAVRGMVNTIPHLVQIVEE